MNTFDVDVEGRTYQVDAPDPNTAWRWAKQFHTEAKAKREQAIAAQQAADAAAFKQSEAERPWLERAATNVGAGMDTAWQGAKQLAAKVGVGPGVSDEELADTRRRKEQLAEGTTGGSLLQIAGEALPTAVLPVGAAGSLGKAAVMGMAGGGAAGALQPVLSNESRLANVALGAAGGGVAPVAVRGIQRMLPRALGGSGEMATETRAGKRLVQALGGPQEADRVATRLEAPNTSQITGQIPLTAAEKAGHPELARVELGARRDAPEYFAEFARRQNEAIHDAAVNRAGIEGTDQFLNIAKNARDIVTEPLRTDALAKAGKFSDVGLPLMREVDALKARTAVGSPARGLADLVERNIAENPSPEQLYELRKLLVRKLSGPYVPGDDVAAIVKGAERETMGMVSAIDARLNEAAQRKAGSQTPWTDYLEEYTRQSPKVTSARAQQQINEALNAEGRPMVGNAPETTRTVLQRAMQRYGSNRFGTRFDPAAESRYSELLDFLARKEEPMRTLKLGGTGGGGSQTSMQQNIAVLTGHALSPKLRIVHMVTDMLAGPVKEEVAQMMLDPARAASGIRAALQAGQPLSQGQQAFLAIARAGGAAAPVAALAPPASQ